MTRHPARCFTRALTFTRAAGIYWLRIWPWLNNELRRWQTQAESIADPTLRFLALHALSAKRGNLEGAAAFAVLSAPEWRQNSVRAMVAFQAIFDYADCLCEQPNHDPIANGRQINQALLQAITPGTAHPDYYSLYDSKNDGGYLIRLVDCCREELFCLPSYTLVSPALDRSTQRIATYQSLNHGDAKGSHQALARWTQWQATRHTQEHGQRLNWWEIAASCGSSLGSFALMAIATRQYVDSQDIEAVEHAYFPWIGATNSLLDSLIDQYEDAAPGQNQLLDNYASSQQVAERLVLITREAAYYANQLSPTSIHTLMFAALLGFYLTDTAATEPGTRFVCEQVRRSVTEFAFPVRMIMRVRRAASCFKLHRQ